MAKAKSAYQRNGISWRNIAYVGMASSKISSEKSWRKLVTLNHSIDHDVMIFW